LIEHIVIHELDLKVLWANRGTCKSVESHLTRRLDEETQGMESIMQKETDKVTNHDGSESRERNEIDNENTSRGKNIGRGLGRGGGKGRRDGTGGGRGRGGGGKGGRWK
jgi:hypothetical protein